jgi:adenosylcobinamide-phosphate synthase
MTALAFLLDIVLGDPRWFPHPVRGMGWLNNKFESLYRKLIKDEIYAGALAAISLLCCCGGLTFLLLLFAALKGQMIYIVTGAILIYFTIAARDLAAHALRIMNPLKSGNLPEARQQLAMIVGRDTADLDENQISRATIESVAENTVDGVTSPLFYALLLGPLGAIIYRAINTMDSMFAYKNEKFINFGRIPEFLDDIANYIPSRLTGIYMCVGALFIGSPGHAWKIMVRDGQKHPSPNSGISEAAVAGALKIQLGGPSTYAGILSKKDTLGNPVNSISLKYIKDSIYLMYSSTLLLLMNAYLILELLSFSKV